MGGRGIAGCYTAESSWHPHGPEAWHERSMRSTHLGSVEGQAAVWRQPAPPAVQRAGDVGQQGQHRGAEDGIQAGGWKVQGIDVGCTEREIGEPCLGCLAGCLQGAASGRHTLGRGAGRWGSAPSKGSQDRAAGPSLPPTAVTGDPPSAGAPTTSSMACDRSTAVTCPRGPTAAAAGSATSPVPAPTSSAASPGASAASSSRRAARGG